MSSNWKTYKLSNLCDIGSSKRIFQHEYVNNGIPFLRSKEVIDKALGSFEPKDLLFISHEKFNEIKSKYNIPKAGELLLSSVGNRSGIPYVIKEADGDFYFKDGNLTWFRNFKSLDSNFLFYWINSSVGQNTLNGIMIGSAQKALTISGLQNLTLTIPPLPIQKKIAHILSTLDDKIELNRKMNQTLESMASAIFKSWFVDFDPVLAKVNCTNEAELENIAKELGISKAILDLFPSEFEESEIGMIPKGWEIKTLEDIIDFQNGYSFKSNELHENPINSTKVLKMGHISRGGGFKEEGKDTYFTVDDKKKIERYYLKKGDLLMAMTDMKANMALLAHTALMPYNDLYLLNQRVGRLRVKENCKIGYSQLYIFTNYLDTIQDLRSRSNSGVQVNLTTKAILETKILMASDELLEKFNMLVEPLFEKMFKNDDEVISLQKTRNKLLPKLLSREIDVSKLEI